MTGAGADRLQTGMSRAFGKKIDRAARVQKGTPIMEARIFEKDLPYVKMGFRMATYKLPCNCSIDVHKFDRKKLDRVYTLEDLEARDARKRQGMSKKEVEAEEEKEAEKAPEKGEAPAKPAEKAPANNNNKK